LHDKVLKEKHLLLELQISKKQKDEVKNLLWITAILTASKSSAKKKRYYLNSNETPNP
jgi:hypothetical protein